MKLILAGGGGASVSLSLDRQMAEWMGSEPRVLYLPFALPADHRLRPSCETWIASVFRPLEVYDIVTWYAREVAASLDGFAGGHTFRLLGILRRSRLDEALVAFATRVAAFHPGLDVVGIAEDAGLVVEDGFGAVMGTGSVTALRSYGDSRAMRGKL